jgi:hypothetical protein
MCVSWRGGQGLGSPVTIGLEELLEDLRLSNPLQPLAALAASEGHAEILQLCLDKGAVFDRDLDAAVEQGLQDTAMLEVLWNAN